MGRIRTIGEKGPENTPLSYRAAREVARGLRRRGWAASARFCQGRTPARIALAGLVPAESEGIPS